MKWVKIIQEPISDVKDEYRYFVYKRQFPSIWCWGMVSPVKGFYDLKTAEWCALAASGKLDKPPMYF